MINYAKLGIAIIGCELVGILGTPFTIQAIPNWYTTLNKPFFAPPNWIFGPVWTTLYALTGIAIYLIWNHGKDKTKVTKAMQLFLAQLVLNFLWTPLFFGLRSPSLGLIDIIAMWVCIVLTIKAFYELSKTAAYLLIPYLLWVTFATALNAAILFLN